jgi:hypothetical protein
MIIFDISPSRSCLEKPIDSRPKEELEHAPTSSLEGTDYAPPTSSTLPAMSSARISPLN